MSAVFDLYALDEDGATVDLGEGRTLRLRIVPDESWSIFDDGDWYGKLAWVDDRRDYRPQRPQGFTGNAEILGIGRGNDRVWWEPPADVPRTAENFDALRRSIIDAMEEGAVGVILEVLEGEDAYGRPIVREADSLWGVVGHDHDYLREIVQDLADNLGFAPIDNHHCQACNGEGHTCICI